jgi:ubiquinone/menaquinone biosynthesis C-methylase UbiE
MNDRQDGAIVNEITRRSNETWETVARAWEVHRDRIFKATRAISDRLVDLIDVKRGGSVLEITAGTGETGFLVAERLGSDGRLISTDFSEAMVRAARVGAMERGLSCVECRVMDAQAIDLPDRSVDAVLSRFGLMLLADPSRALHESRRVLRPGGRLAYAVWGAPEANPWITLLAGAFLQGGHVLGGDPFGPGGIFSMAEPERNFGLASDAGFAEVTVEELSGAMRAHSLEDYWDFQTSISGPIGALVADLSPDEAGALQAIFRSAVEPYRTGVAYELPFRAVIVHATG